MTVVEWLLDSDPAIRWQVMRDLTHDPADVVAAERARVAREGWVARLLALQGPDGHWGGGFDAPGWTDTYNTLKLLPELGVDPTSAEARRAIGLVRDNVTWVGVLPQDAAWHGKPFFDGEVEPCINGSVVVLGSYFGQDVQAIVNRLLGEQRSDGGWNCEAVRGSTRSSFNTTICVLEGLLEHERATGGSPEATAARLRAHEYLLERRLFRRLSSGEVIDATWTMFSFPTRYHYDILRGLDYLRAANAVPDERAAEAIDLVESKRGEDGRWLLENPHAGQVHFEMEEGEGKPSRWNTLRAMRVLAWYAQGAV